MSDFRNIPSFLIFLTLFVSEAHARQCFVNEFGNVVCTGLSNGARIGIAIAVFVVIMILLIALTFWRRRRLRQHNLVYITNPNNGMYPSNNYGQGGQPNYPPPAGYPQYPPQAYAEQPQNAYAPRYSGYNKGNNSESSYPYGGPGSPPLVTKGTF